MVKNIIKLFIEKGFLLDKDMLNFFKELKDEDVAREIIDKIGVISRKKVITKELVDKNIEKIKPMLFIASQIYSKYLLYGLVPSRYFLKSRFNYPIKFNVWYCSYCICYSRQSMDHITHGRNFNYQHSHTIPPLQ